MTAAGTVGLDAGRPAWVRVQAFELLLAARARRRATLDGAASRTRPADGAPVGLGARGGAGRGPRPRRDPFRAMGPICAGHPEGPARLLDVHRAAGQPSARRGQERAGAAPPRSIRSTRETLLRLGDEKLQARVASVLQAAPDSNRREVIRRYQPAPRARGRRSARGDALRSPLPDVSCPERPRTEGRPRPDQRRRPPQGRLARRDPRPLARGRTRRPRPSSW